MLKSFIFIIFLSLPGLGVSTTVSLLFILPHFHPFVGLLFQGPSLWKQGEVVCSSCMLRAVRKKAGRKQFSHSKRGIIRIRRPYEV